METKNFGRRNHCGRKDIPITDFFNTHAWLRQLSGESPVHFAWLARRPARQKESG
jgi:hypothetical protein